MKPYYQDSHCTIYHGDAKEILPELDPVDVVFTSPPYWQQRDYGIEKFDWIDTVAKTIPKTKDQGDTQIIVNLGTVYKSGRLFPYWNYLIDEMEAADWRWYDQYIWGQGEGLPGDFNGRLAPSHEYLFHFNRKYVKLNKTEKCLSTNRTNSGANILSKRNGYKKGYKIGDRSVGEYKISNSIINIQRQVDRSGIEAGHPAVFPMALPKKIITIWGCKTIVDPFMGSGTTLRGAKDLNCKAIGIDISENNCEMAANRLKQEVLKL